MRPLSAESILLDSTINVSFNKISYPICENSLYAIEQIL